MSSNTNRTIFLKGQPEGKRREAVANAAIKPGYLCEYMSSGNVRKHATAGGNAYSLFAGENELFGDDIDTSYATNDRALLWHATPGDEINALVAAAASAIVIGDLLDSAGDGTLRKYTAPSQAVAEGGSASYTIAPKVLGPIAVAMEAVDNSGGSSEARIRVMIL